MERAAFYDEERGTRIPCLLNPERVVHRRVAGLRPMASVHGGVTGAPSRDTPLLHTGGGRTEIELDLLVDVQLARSVAPGTSPAAPPAGPSAEAPAAAAAPGPTDVRELTRALWELAENSASGRRGVPRARFVWGKAWNVPVVVEALAERLERFDPGGAPGRSWMRVRLVRVAEPPSAQDATDPTEVSAALPDPQVALTSPPAAVHTVLGGGGPGTGGAPGGQTLVQVTAEHFGDRPWLWRWVADANPGVDVVWPEPGRELVVPPDPATLGPSGGRP